MNAAWADDLPVIPPEADDDVSVTFITKKWLPAHRGSTTIFEVGPEPARQRGSGRGQRRPADGGALVRCGRWRSKPREASPSTEKPVDMVPRLLSRHCRAVRGWTISPGPGTKPPAGAGGAGGAVQDARQRPGDVDPSHRELRPSQRRTWIRGAALRTTDGVAVCGSGMGRTRRAGYHRLNT